MTTDEHKIRELIDTWLAASAANDTETVMNLIADDAIFMVPGQKPFGKEAFAAASRGLRAFRIEGTSDIQEIQIFGDWAYLRNFLQVAMTPVDDGKTIRRSGYTLTILRKKANGNWELVRDANLLAVE